MGRVVFRIAGAVCLVFLALGIHDAGLSILSWLGLMLLPLPVFALGAWIVREERDIAKARRDRPRDVVPTVVVPTPVVLPEIHLVVAALPSTVTATSVTGADPRAFYYARFEPTNADLPGLAHALARRADRVETASGYREGAFADPASSGRGLRVVVMGFETPVTHSSAAPPEDAVSVRALLERIRAQPIAEGVVLRMVPSSAGESLTEGAVRALYPELHWLG